MVSIKDFPGYWIDRKGRIYSSLIQSNRGGWATGFETKIGHKPIRTLKPSITHSYAHVTLWRNGKRFERRVHLLVLEAFTGKRPRGAVARHLNGKSLDNRIENLEWGTQKDNAADREKHGHTHMPHLPKRTISTETVVEIRNTARGRGVAEMLAQRFGISAGTVYGIWGGRKRKYG